MTMGVLWDTGDMEKASIEAESSVREKEEDEQAEEWGDLDEVGW